MTSQWQEVTFTPLDEALTCSAEDCSGRRLTTWASATKTWEPVRTHGVDATVCLHHASTEQGDAFFSRLFPDGPLDLYQTTLTTETVAKLKENMKSQFGICDFRNSTFPDGVNFEEATFGRAAFDGATFTRQANFTEASFKGLASFNGATFTEASYFSQAEFMAETYFMEAEFTGEAVFTESTFASTCHFHRAVFIHDSIFAVVRFDKDVYFSGVRFNRIADFIGSEFKSGWVSKQMECGGTLNLYGSRFYGPVDLSIEVAIVYVREARWEHSVTLRLNGFFETNLARLVSGRRTPTAIDLADMVRNADYPFLVLGPDQFLEPGETSTWPERSGEDVRAIVVDDLSGTDVARMVLTNVDVSQTVFVNAINLDQIRLEGRCRYLHTPCPDWGRNGFVHRSSRAAIGAEDMWRRNRVGAPSIIRFPRDSVAFHNSRGVMAGPSAIAPVYRYLRKALEDGKDEPGAADFYYGEMEMRRLDQTRPKMERSLIAAYWAISGYGLRASRAVCALMAVMLLSFTLLLIFGIPNKESAVYTVGSISADFTTLAKSGQKVPETCRVHQPSECSVVVTIGESVDPTAPTSAISERFTAERAGKALEVVSSVSLLNSDEQELTGLGKVIAFASRVLGALLLGLALLAVRNRVKR